MDDDLEQILEFCQEQALIEFLKTIPPDLHEDLLDRLEKKPLHVPARLGNWRTVYTFVMDFIRDFTTSSNKEPKPYRISGIIQDFLDQLEERFGHWR